MYELREPAFSYSDDSALEMDTLSLITALYGTYLNELQRVILVRAPFSLPMAFLGRTKNTSMNDPEQSQCLCFAFASNHGILSY